MLCGLVGYRPFPTAIEKVEFETLLEEIDAKTRELVSQWFYLDTNRSDLLPPQLSFFVFTSNACSQMPRGICFDANHHPSS